MTPPVFTLNPEPGAELDLDTPVTGPRRQRRWRGPLALFVAVVLVGASAGAVTRTLTAGTPPPPPPQAELSFATAHLAGDTVASLRLTVHNFGGSAITVTALEAEGIRDGRVTAAVDGTVPAGQTAAFLVPVDADCTRSLIFTSLEAQVRLADGETVPAVPDRVLASAGGLCRQLRAALPDGWWDPLPGVTGRVVGDRLELTLPPLDPGVKLAGVWVGQTLLATESPPVLVGTSYPSIRLLPPAGCPVATGDRVPTGVKILTTGNQRLRSRYSVIGPDLARWLLRGC
jgi:hypothetical protein